jgi:GGDEF domain-containing protein
MNSPCCCPSVRSSRPGPFAGKLRAAVDGYRLDWEGHSYAAGASIGLVYVDGAHASAADVLREADAACYAAKRQGRNRVVAAVSAAEPLP